MENAKEHTPGRIHWVRRIILLAVSGLLCGALVALFAAREPTEPLTVENLHHARQRWDSAGIRNYRLTTQVGSQTYAAEVRDGRVVDLRTADGKLVTSHDIQSYSVDGWFDVLERDLELRDDPSSPLGAAAGNALLRVRYNQRYAYLERYVRSIPGGRSQVVQVESFEPL
ncbi:MAG TPA: DUF6174 domain-containing protein [Phycisphaerae bacterium]|jgi:hypothetical protein